jgi:HEAT repeat protein
LIPVILLLAASAASDLLHKMEDPSLNPTQRNNACYELRGAKQNEVLAAMRHALNDPELRACAAENLRIAGALDLFRNALQDEDSQVRAVAALELGGFGKVEDLPALDAATRDRDLLVATNSVYGLGLYPGKDSVPYLVAAAKRGGLVGEQALHRLAQRNEPEALDVARMLLTSKEAPDRLAAIAVIGQMGDRSDLAALREIQQKETGELSNKGRGFGLIPTFSLSRAAKTAIENIESRHAVQ